VNLVLDFAVLLKSGRTTNKQRSKYQSQSTKPFWWSQAVQFPELRSETRTNVCWSKTKHAFYAGLVMLYQRPSICCQILLTQVA